MSATSEKKTLFALALMHIDGVGRVTTSRLLSNFDNVEDLRRYPREQVLFRIKGARNAQKLVKNLFDDAFLEEHLDYARRHTAKLAEKNIQLLVQGSSHWPERLDALDRSHRPVLLYLYGAAAVLSQPGVAFLARPPLSEDPFERSQDLVKQLVAEQIPPLSGVSHGFDNVVQKFTVAEDKALLPSVMVANCGLAKIPSGLRATASQAVRSGSVMVSPFSMAHGPYEHDDYERALLQTALADKTVFLEPRSDTAEWRAMKWAAVNGRSVFAFPHADHPLPPGVTPIPTEENRFNDIAARLVEA